MILIAFSASVYADGFNYNSVTASYGQIDFDDLNADGDILGINGSAAIGESFFVFGGFGMADISANPGNGADVWGFVDLNSNR